MASSECRYLRFSSEAWHEAGGGHCDPLFRWCGKNGLGVVEQVPDLSGDVALQGPDRFAFGFAF